MGSHGWTLACLTALVLLRLQLFGLYSSTDMEVHRHWKALTSRLPMSRWYLDESSIWTLDYPPFFAWFERGIASLRGSDAFPLEAPKSREVDLLFMRSSVVLTEAMLVFAIFRFARAVDVDHAERNPRLSWKKDVPFVLLLTLANPGLLFVDRKIYIDIHFQYNGFLIGIYIWSIALIKDGKDLCATIVFAALLQFKHIFLYTAPLFFVYLLSNYCFELKQSPTHFQRAPAKSTYRKWSSFRFLSLGFFVLLIFTISLGPFIYLGQLKVLMGRLFPFQRGLSHAYWAPNVWALYNALDKVLFVFLKKILKSRVLNFSSMTRGIIGDIVHLVLPSIRSHHTAILTIASMAPVLISVYRRPFPKTFLAAANYCTMCSFMLGWHVHEKAILMVILPLGMEALKSKFYFDFFTFFTTLSSFSLFPLLHEPQELPVKILILVLYHILVLSIARHRVMAKLKTRRTQTPPFGFLRMAYLCGFVPIQLFTLIQPWIFKTWEFLPLLVTSVYCSFGMLYAWKKTWDIYWLEYRLAMELYQE